MNQLNKISHDIAQRVGPVIGVAVPEPDPEYYHNDTSKGISFLGEKLRSIAGLRVGVLATVGDQESLSQAAELKEKFKAEGVTAFVVAERLGEGVDMTYSATRAHAFDGVVVASGAEELFNPGVTSPLYPAGRPAQTLEDAYRWGKPIGAMGPAAKVYDSTVVKEGPGVYAADDTADLVDNFKDGLAQFKFVDRFVLDGATQPGNTTTAEP